MNAKIAKALRRMAREGAKPGTPEHRLLAKPVRVMRNGQPVQKIIAVNAKNSERGRYLALKKAYEEHPEVREVVDGNIRYSKMLHAQQAAGAPTFNQGKEQS